MNNVSLSKLRALNNLQIMEARGAYSLKSHKMCRFHTITKCVDFMQSQPTCLNCRLQYFLAADLTEGTRSDRALTLACAAFSDRLIVEVAETNEWSDGAIRMPGRSEAYL